MNAANSVFHALNAVRKSVERRAKQSVHRCSSRYGGWSDLPPRHVVLVTPDGAERGLYYEVSDQTWKRLEDGMTPKELGLEPFDPTEDDDDDFEAEFNRYRRNGAF